MAILTNEKQLDKVLERYYNRYSKYNEKVLKLLGKTIKEIGEMKPSEVHRLGQQIKYNEDINNVINELAKITDKSTEDIEKLFDKFAKENVEFSEVYYEAQDKEYVGYDNNVRLQRMVQGIANNTKDTMINLSNTRAVGFVYKDNFGNSTFKDLKTTYQDLIDEAVYQVATGTKDYGSAMRSVMNGLADSGIRTHEDKIGYKSGYRRRLDSAIRQNILDGLRKINIDIQKQIGDEIGADGIEISAHILCAPDHIPYQGRQYTKEEFKNINTNELERPIATGGYNCGHFAMQVVLGVDEPQYTDEQLKRFEEESFSKVEYNGKTYTKYEATQLQRSLETAIRKQKDRQIVARASGDKEGILKAQQKISQLTTEYKRFSNIAGLQTKMGRLTVSGYRRVGIGTSKNTITYKTLQNKDFTALENNTKNLINKLNEKELKSLGNYASEEFEDINKTLANPKIEDDQLWLYDKKEDVWKDINNIDSAIKKATINENITTFRGTASRYFDNKQIGEEFEMPLYFSTSGKESIARDKFMRNISYKENPALLEIKVPKGTNGIYMGDLFNENGLNEFEVLLDRKLKYKVADIKDIDTSGYNEDGIYVHGTKYKKITLEVINDNKRKMGNR